MTVQKIYSVYDRKAGYYMPPFPARGDAEASRWFSNSVSAGDTALAQYPADFDLVCVGEMDMDTGKILQVFPCEILLNGLVAFQDAFRERKRYLKVRGEQVDIEDFLSDDVSGQTS